MEVKEFEKSKIFEKLDYEPQPSGYQSKIPWIIQQQIGATNGIHYASMIGQLQEYPIPEIQVPAAERENQLLLDIGCGWGRWLVAAGKKKYIPVGIDLRLEFCQTARNIMFEHNITGYTVVADLKQLPFKTNVLDAVWSFSVIQHTHRERLESCIQEINRILHKNGFCKLEFPNKNGLRNRFGPVRREEKEKDDYNSWCVRYYSISEYRELFKKYFDNFSFSNHSFLGIGVLPEDLNYIKDRKLRLQIQLSLFLSRFSEIISPLKYLSDSIYITAKKNSGTLDDVSTNAFLQNHYSGQDNLNIIPLLCCPITKTGLQLSEDGNYLLSSAAQRKFPVINRIPILVQSQSEPL